MRKAKKLKIGDRVAIVSLSSGMLGDKFCSHNLEIGTKRLKEMGLIPVFMPNSLSGSEFLDSHPDKRAYDLKHAFLDDTISGIICAIGGDDTYRTLPFLMEDDEFKQAVRKNPKLFIGFSDTTINHLMFYQLGLTSYYGPSFITDLGEISNLMLPYTDKWFQSLIEGNDELLKIQPSDYWYEERTDYSIKALGQNRLAYHETKGYELLQGKRQFEGALLGGCTESLYDILTSSRYGNEKEICEKYRLFPTIEQWENKIFFMETSEEKPTPELFEKELLAFKETGLFNVIAGIIVGKPQDEKYYEAYKDVLLKVIDDPTLPILYNVNFGHATPRCILGYGLTVLVDYEKQKIVYQEALLNMN